MRYEVSVASELVGLEPDLVPYARIGRTNVSNDFADPVTFRIGDIDPTAVLAAPARSRRAEDVAPYRLLFGPNRERAYPFLCSYFPEARLIAEELCGAPA